MKNGIKEMIVPVTIVDGYVVYSNGSTGMSIRKMSEKMGISLSSFNRAIASWDDGEPNRVARSIIANIVGDVPDSPVSKVVIDGNVTSIVKESVIMSTLVHYSESSDAARNAIMAFGQAGVRVYINGMVGNDTIGLIEQVEQLQLEVIEAENMYFSLESDNMKLDIANRDLKKSVGGFKASATKWERMFNEVVEVKDAALDQAEEQARRERDKVAMMAAIEHKTAQHNAEVAAMIAQVK